MQPVSEKISSISEGNCSPKAGETADPAMVVALGPGKFYGSSLPRPRFYTDVKLNEERVDPPVSVLDPLMSWAEEAHWSMGGLSFQRHRLQGRIEGNVNKLRAEREKILKSQGSNFTPRRGANKTGFNEGGSPVTPAAPIAVKRRRRLVGVVDEESSDVEEEQREVKRTARKLGADFDRVANDKIGDPVKNRVAETMAARTRSQRAIVVAEKETKVKPKGKKLVNKSFQEAEEAAAAKGTRTSPRLAKRN